MPMVGSVNPCEVIVNRLESIRSWASLAVRNPKVGLAGGLAVSALTAAPMPLPQLALIGPLLAASAYGAFGGRLAALIGFGAYLLTQPTLAQALAAAGIAATVAWGVPALVAKSQETSQAVPEGAEKEGAAAVVIDCDGFSTLDASYGEGASAHVFKMLHRALKTETREDDLIVYTDGQELILVLDGASPSVAQTVMARVERRFGQWLSDAGYECNLTVGLADVENDEAEFNDLLRAARRYEGGPYVD